ncbi:hypothetical protein PAXRUDRAFT_154092, partial [Paxillus rubicundulus Ve08.2h10]
QWAWLHLPNGQIAQSLWTESQKSLDDVQMAHHVKVSSLPFHYHSSIVQLNVDTS